MICKYKYSIYLGPICTSYMKKIDKSIKNASQIIHYKESCPFQPMHLQLLSKSTIFVTLDLTIFHTTW